MNGKLASWVPIEDGSELQPLETGWYAVLRRWDSYEGIFHGLCFYNGLDLGGGNPPIIYRSPKAFASAAAADAWAYAHDPEL
jgi:hypothetical protein